jgi:hypothetical protein
MLIPDKELQKLLRSSFPDFRNALAKLLAESHEEGYRQGYFDGKEDYIQGTWNRSLEPPSYEEG